MRRNWVNVDLIVPVDRDGGRIERNVLWVVMGAERFEIELKALRQALPDQFGSETPSDGPTVQQVQRILIGQGSPASRAPVHRLAGEAPARPEPTPPRRRGWAGPTVAALLAYALLGKVARAEMVFVTPNRSEADERVYVTENRSDAECFVYVTDSRTEAQRHPAIWFLTPNRTEATVKIFWSATRTDADLRIYFTRSRTEAKCSGSPP